MKLLHIFMPVLLLACIINATEYHVDTEQDNMVLFISEAPVESFDGTTSKIDGYVKWQGDDPLNDSEFYFEVDLATFDTGIGLRNQHMRDNYLETDEYQYAMFHGNLVSMDTLDIANTYDVVVAGTMNLHGVDKTYTIDGRVSFDGDQMNVQTGFEIMLEDHNIKIPKLMFVKISQLIQLDINFYLTKVDEE